MEYLNRSYRVWSEILPIYMLNWLKGTLYLTDRYDETSWFIQCASAEQRNLPRFETETNNNVGIFNRSCKALSA